MRFTSELLLFFRSSHSPESGVGSHTSHDSEVERLYANAEAEIEAEIVVDGLHVTGHDDEDDTINGEFYESELLPVLGTCRALYAFEGDFNFNSFNQWRQSISDTIADWLTLWSRDEAQTRGLASFIYKKFIAACRTALSTSSC